MTYLTDAEVEAPLEAPEQATRTGRRDHAIMETFIATGLRAGELTALTDQDRKLTKPSHLVVRGKGRKDRITPLNRATVTTLGRWRDENPNLAGASPLFSAQGSTRPTSVDAIAARIHAHITTAEATCHTLTGKNISPHTLRHTCAMRMLAAGINITTIALWLGHESTEATQAYLHADLGMKQRALDRVTPPTVKTVAHYTPTNRMLNFLESL